MIDVVFLLIIFFLCIDFRVLEAKLPAYLPKDKGSSDSSSVEVEQLQVRIVCDAPGVEHPRPGGRSTYRIGHRVHYSVGPVKLASLSELRAELQRIHDDPSYQVVDLSRGGGTKLQSVVVQPQPGVVYGDVAPCVDAIADVGFSEIHFGGGMGRRGR